VGANRPKLLANETLYQLSYDPEPIDGKNLRAATELQGLFSQRPWSGCSSPMRRVLAAGAQKTVNPR